MFNLRIRQFILILMFCPFSDFLIAQKNDPTTKRVSPPKWDKSSTSIFFEDAFREALQGPRPSFGSVVQPEIPATDSHGNSNTSTQKSNRRAWSGLILAATIENEIKRIKNQTDQLVTTPAKFASQGHQDAKQLFSTAAALFGIVAEYDDDIRWKRDAETARDLFAQTAHDLNDLSVGNARVGMDVAYREAMLRKSDLRDLISGAKLTRRPIPTDGWDAVVDRSSLMKRITTAYLDRIKKWTTSDSSFHENSDEIKHEAEMISAFGNVLMKDGMEGFDDEEYQAFCDLLISGAKEMASAVENESFELTRSANGKISNACDQCHQVFK